MKNEPEHSHKLVVWCVVYDGPAVGVMSVWLSEERADRDAAAAQHRDDIATDAKEHYHYSVEGVEISDLGQRLLELGSPESVE